MAARATRSASRSASSSGDDTSRCLLLALSHDELGVVFDGLANPLQPVVAVALSSTCLGLRTPLRAALEVLKVRHARAVALCRKLNSGYMDLTRGFNPSDRDGISCAVLRDAWRLSCGRPRKEVRKGSRSLNSVDMATLGMILPWMPKLQELSLHLVGIDDAGMQALCEGLVRGSMPALYDVNLSNNEIGASGAEALAAALCKLPGLNCLHLFGNPFGDQGMAALATPLRKLPHLEGLKISQTDISDDGLDLLLANLSKDDFKELEELHLFNDDITGKGYAALASALVDGAMPKLSSLPDARMAMADKADALEARGVYLHLL